jgi:hypothetical protein
VVLSSVVFIHVFGIFFNNGTNFLFSFICPKLALTYCWTINVLLLLFNGAMNVSEVKSETLVSFYFYK